MSEAELYRFHVANCKIKFDDIISTNRGSLDVLIEVYAAAVHKYATVMTDLSK